MKNTMMVTKDLLKYAVGAIAGVAVYASAQHAVSRLSVIEVAPTLLHAAEPPQITPQAQLALLMQAAQVFANKLAQNATSPGKHPEVFLQY